ncbi:hypothetical protein FQA47_023564 [Oryzias melastigma]|uniref:Uncharacterized protein n=1 Tax=Oryzias melastigma TaxID=30732 RepID=A0A834FPM7_ORYME|nr:hypothetical protein FQA47_023564 [Oryzias melastigma]
MVPPAFMGFLLRWAEPHPLALFECGRSLKQMLRGTKEVQAEVGGTFLKLHCYLLQSHGRDTTSLSPWRSTPWFQELFEARITHVIL